MSVAVASEGLEWVPLGGGVSFRPLKFGPGAGRSLQLKVEPGVTIGRHRHTGHVHAFGVSGARELIEAGEIAGPGSFVYEPSGNVDSWRCVGDEPCVVQISMTGRVEYLNDDDSVASWTDTDKLKAIYLAWCAETGLQPAVG